MKKYHIVKPYEDEDRVTIYNDDENPVITKVEFHSRLELQERYRGVRIVFRDETKEIKQKFKEASRPSTTMMGVESLAVEKTMDNIIEYLNIVQEIDPVPLSAFREVSALIDYDFSTLINYGRVDVLVNKGKEPSALQEALAATLRGDTEVLTQLANRYESNQDNDNYFNVLEHFPQNHPSFTDANKLIHEYLLTIIPQNEAHQLHLLERKFRAVLNSNQSDIASNYFDELCGNSGLNPSICDVKGDPDTLIQIARKQRVMQKELEELRAYKEARSNKNKSKGKSNVTPSSLFGKSQKMEMNPIDQKTDEDEARP